MERENGRKNRKRQTEKTDTYILQQYSSCTVPALKAFGLKTAMMQNDYVTSRTPQSLSQILSHTFIKTMSSKINFFPFFLLQINLFIFILWIIVSDSSAVICIFLACFHKFILVSVNYLNETL